MKPDRVRTVGRSRAEYTMQRVAVVVTGTHGQYVAPGSMEPSQHDELLADVQILDPFGDIGVEHEVRIWRSLVALLRSGVGVDERGAGSRGERDSSLMWEVLGGCSTYSEVGGRGGFDGRGSRGDAA